MQPGNHSVILYSMDCQFFFVFFNAADLDHMVVMTLVAVGDYAGNPMLLSRILFIKVT